MSLFLLDSAFQLMFLQERGRKGKKTKEGKQREENKGKERRMENKEKKVKDRKSYFIC